MQAFLKRYFGEFGVCNHVNYGNFRDETEKDITS